MTAASLSSWFWDDNFWLPPNVTWKDIQRTGGGTGETGEIQYAEFADLAYPIVGAWLMLLLKFIVEKKLLRILGVKLGLKNRKKGAAAGVTSGGDENRRRLLEEAFKGKKAVRDMSEDELCALAKKVDMTERQVEVWFRQRALANKASKLDKFAESGWKAFFYTTMYAYSWAVLWNKEWFWDIKYCWFRYPQHSLPGDIWLYYMIELSFYWSLLISQFFDVQRSDFWEMFAHHVATISLLGLSWACNLFRVGSLVLWVHDCADVFLESAKMFKYIGAEKVSDILFYGFAVSWVVTRLGFFPTWIIYSINVEAGQFIQYFPAYHVFSGLLSVLLVLNLFWFYFIVKVAYLQAISPDGKIEKDLRSESNSSD